MVWGSGCSSDSFKPSHMRNSSVVFIHVLLRPMSDVELEAFGIWPRCIQKLWQSFGVRTIAIWRMRRAAAGASRSWNCFTVRGCHLPKAKLDTQYCNFLLALLCLWWLVASGRCTQISGVRSFWQLSFVRWRQILSVLSMQRASYHPSGTYSFKVAPIVWNICAPLSSYRLYE